MFATVAGQAEQMANINPDEQDASDAGRKEINHSSCLLFYQSTGLPVISCRTMCHPF